jgi:acetylcholinesterase
MKSLSLAWSPREDGVFLNATPQQLVAQGFVAPVPFVTGDVDDEGTLFSLINSNLTTDDEVAAYLQQYFVAQSNFNASAVTGNATSAQDLVAQILEAYPADPTQGSPFDTGSENAITAQYKRIAAILGDIVFQAPRRFFLQNTAGKQTQFAYLSKRGKATPFVGAAHSSDVPIIYGKTDMTDYLIRFGTTLDPNGGNTNSSQIAWPAYTSEAPTLLTFLDGNTTLALSNDTYRAEGMQTIIQASFAAPL